MRRVTLVCDMQYGSTGKGLIAGYLAHHEGYDTVVTAWSPNAGHTFIDANGRKYIHTMLANGSVAPSVKNILIGPGSVINLDSLVKEITGCQDKLRDKIIYIHPNAAIVRQRHRDIEAAAFKGISSTAKGSAEAVIEKMRRATGGQSNTVSDNIKEVMTVLSFSDVGVVVSAVLYNAVLRSSENVLIEGHQGFSLSIHHGHYPYTTSRDVTPAQILADCGVPIPDNLYTIGTLRTFPIRVGNVYDDSGRMVSFSGPCYPDQNEISFEDLGVPDEFTTVTQKKRRVFTFSFNQLRDALHMCRPNGVFLNFCNYLGEANTNELIHAINNVAGLDIVRFSGWGPSISDVKSVVPYEE